jgi:uncharacterized membrane protein
MKKSISLWVFVTFFAIVDNSATAGMIHFLNEKTRSFGISGNGKTVVGVINVGSDEKTDEKPFKWTHSDGVVILEVPDGNVYGAAFDCSYDGSVIVGRISDGEVNGYAEACRWTSDGEFQKLGILPGYLGSIATAVSGDGNIVIGYCYSLDGGQAFRWTAAEGMVGLGFLPGHTSSGACSISEDGSVIVGTCETVGAASVFLWTAAEGMTALELSSPLCYANKISADGSTIVGYCDHVGFLWTPAEGKIDLKIPSGALYTSPIDISGDGSVVLGSTGNSDFIWDSVNGIRDLKGFLKEKYHLNIPDISVAHGISDDAQILTGYAGYPDTAWVANLAISVDISGDWSVDAEEVFSAKGLNKVTETSNNVFSFSFVNASNGTIEFITNPSDLSTGTYKGTFTVDSQGTKVTWSLNESSLQNFKEYLRKRFIGLAQESGVISDAFDVTDFQLTKTTFNPIKVSKKIQSPMKVTIQAIGTATGTFAGKATTKKFKYCLTGRFSEKSF